MTAGLAGRSVTYYDETPLDIVEMVLDRALHAPDPADNSPVFVRRNDHQPGRDLFQNGLQHLARKLWLNCSAICWSTTLMARARNSWPRISWSWRAIQY